MCCEGTPSCLTTFPSLLPQPRIGRPKQGRFVVTDDMNRHLAKEVPKATFPLGRLAESTILQGSEDAR